MNASPEPASSDADEHMTILLVEDDAAVRRSLQMLLSAKGYAVRSFASCTAVLADAALDQASCLVADFRLAEMDGLALHRRMRARGWRGAAILITAFGTDELIGRALHEGFGDVIEKPLLDHQLERAIGRLIGPGEALAARSDRA